MPYDFYEFTRNEQNVVIPQVGEVHNVLDAAIRAYTTFQQLPTRLTATWTDVDGRVRSHSVVIPARLNLNQGRWVTGEQEALIREELEQFRQTLPEQDRPDMPDNPDKPTALATNSGHGWTNRPEMDELFQTVAIARDLRKAGGAAGLITANALLTDKLAEIRHEQAMAGKTDMVAQTGSFDPYAGTVGIADNSSHKDDSVYEHAIPGRIRTNGGEHHDTARHRAMCNELRECGMLPTPDMTDNCRKRVTSAYQWTDTHESDE